MYMYSKKERERDRQGLPTLNHYKPITSPSNPPQTLNLYSRQKTTRKFQGVCEEECNNIISGSCINRLTLCREKKGKGKERREKKIGEIQS